MTRSVNITCEKLPKEIIDSVVQDALEEQDESGDSVFTAIDTVYKKRNFKKYKQETPDMSITVGHVIDNPTFDFDGNFRIITADEAGHIDVLYDNMWDNTKDIPADLLIKPVKHIMTPSGSNGLVLEV